jgi:S1-C subfamily serine protease
VVIQGKTDSGEVLGSGFIVSSDGKIVTNLHVVRDMNAAAVQTATGHTFSSVMVLATDETKDLAIIKIAGMGLPALELGNSEMVSVGEQVVIVGSPRGLEGSVTAGIISSVRDGGSGFKVLQTDAAMNPGNSGGPLVNTKGQAIGVASFKITASEGLNFAIPWIMHRMRPGAAFDVASSTC